MIAPESTKPAASNQRVSKTALLCGLLDYKRRNTFRQFAKPQPPLESLYAELVIFETLLRAPLREFYYVRHRTLTAMRWMGAERVVRAAVRDGKSKEQATALLQRVLAHVATPPFYEAEDCVAWVIGAAYSETWN